MKRSWLAVLVVFSIFFAAVPVLAKEAFVRIGTSSVGGGFYLIGNTIAQLGTEKEKDINFTAVTGGSIKNCIKLGTKEMELGLAQSSTITDAWNGTGSFKQPIKSLRYVTAIYPMPAHILVNLAAGINNIGDFKDKRVDFGSVGQGIEINLRQIMSVYGLKDEDVKVERYGRSEVAEALKVGDSQAHIWTTNAPNAQVTDMIRSGKVGLIGIEPEKIDEIVTKYPHFTPAVIPGGVYEGYDKNIPTVATVGSLLTYADMPEDVIYRITKMLYTNIGFLQQRLSYFNNMKLDSAIAGMSVPLHPGAKRFYVEAGLIKE